MDKLVLLTDFGNQDGYAGVMRGVIGKINPQASVIDLSHEVPPQDIHAANFILYTHYRYFPEGSIFVIVVDPEVGTKRRPLIVQTEHYFFVTPDNGSLSYLLSQEKPKKVIHVQNASFFLPRVSSSFHGRDVFSPVGAHLSLGRGLSEFGPSIPASDIISWPFPKVKKTRDGLKGCVLYIDCFGNLITNIHEKDLSRLPKKFSVTVKEKFLGEGCRTYADRQPGEFLSFIASGGLLEIAQNMGNAGRVLKAAVGDEVVVQVKRRKT